MFQGNDRLLQFQSASAKAYLTCTMHDQATMKPMFMVIMRPSSSPDSALEEADERFVSSLCAIVRALLLQEARMEYGMSLL